MESVRERVRELAGQGLSVREIQDVLDREQLEPAQRAAASMLASEEFAMARRRRIWSHRQIEPHGRKAA